MENTNLLFVGWNLLFSSVLSCSPLIYTWHSKTDFFSLFCSCFTYRFQKSWYLIVINLIFFFFTRRSSPLNPCLLFLWVHLFVVIPSICWEYKSLVRVSGRLVNECPGANEPSTPTSTILSAFCGEIKGFRMVLWIPGGWRSSLFLPGPCRDCGYSPSLVGCALGKQKIWRNIWCTGEK